MSVALWLSATLSGVISSASAAPIYWVLPPSEADRAAADRAVSDAEHLSLDLLLTQGQPLPPVDNGALGRLQGEITAAPALFDALDGELQVMARLDKAAADVHLLRSPQERDLLWEGLLLQGYAVSRYYQDKVGTDPLAAPYRVDLGGGPLIRPWVTAASLEGVPSPTERQLPESQQRLEYDRTKAAVQGMPRGSVVIGALPAGAKVYLDGQALLTSPGQRLSVTPGVHYWHVEVGSQVLALSDARLEPGQDALVQVPMGPAERDQLLQGVVSGKSEWTRLPFLPLLAQAPGLSEFYLAVPGKRLPEVYRVTPQGVEQVSVPRQDPSDQRGFGGAVSLMGSWVYNTDFYTLNAPQDDTLTYGRSAVNAYGPAVKAAGSYHYGLLTAEVGVIGQQSLGEGHTLPVGSASTSLLAHPYVGVGVPWLQVAAGPIFPWHVGVGAEASWPLGDHLLVTGSFRQGFSLPRAYDEATGAEDFQPAPTRLAGVGIGWRLGE